MPVMAHITAACYDIIRAPEESCFAIVPERLGSTFLATSELKVTSNKLLLLALSEGCAVLCHRR